MATIALSTTSVPVLHACVYIGPAATRTGCGQPSPLLSRKRIQVRVLERSISSMYLRSAIGDSNPASPACTENMRSGIRGANTLRKPLRAALEVRARGNQEGALENEGKLVTVHSSSRPAQNFSRTIRSPSKQCENCHHWKLEVDFQETTTTADGLQGFCRACFLEFKLRRANKELHHLAMSPEEAWEKSKPCTKCRLVKEVRDFARDTRSKSGLQSWCRACSSTAHKTGPSYAPQDTPQQCIRCNEVKPASEFYPVRGKFNGRQSHCRACQLLCRKEWTRKRQALHVPKVEKRCTKCGQVKQSAEFSKDTREADGLLMICRICSARGQRAFRQRKKNAFKAVDSIGMGIQPGPGEG